MGPDTSKTFRDLILDVAVETGKAVFAVEGDGAPQVPTDAADLWKIKRAINDGIAEMRLRYPKWRALQRRVELSLGADGDLPDDLGGDAARKVLPWYVSGPPARPWVVSADGQSLSLPVATRPAATIEALHAGDNATGHPRAVGYYEADPGRDDVQNRRRWVAHFHPTPDADYTAVGWFRLVPRTLLQLSERHLFGAQHDQTVVAAALYLLNRHSPDPAAGTYAERFADLLAASIEQDRQLNVESEGVLGESGGDEDESGLSARRQYGGGVSTLNGVAIN